VLLSHEKMAVPTKKEIAYAQRNDSTFSLRYYRSYLYRFSTYDRRCFHSYV